MTNFERIKAMSVEEMAWELFMFRFDACGKANGDESVLPSCQKDICEWLESEVQDESNP